MRPTLGEALLGLSGIFLVLLLLFAAASVLIPHLATDTRLDLGVLVFFDLAFFASFGAGLVTI